MNQDQAYTILTKYMSNPNLLKHSYAAQAAMKGIYKYLHRTNYLPPEEEKWGIVGFLHDADYEMSKGKPEKHGLLLFDYEPDIPEDIAYAIKAHNPATKVEPQSEMDWAIRSCDQLTGLIVASALVLPDKKIASLTKESVLKRFNERSFARGADRTQIKLCEDKLAIPIERYIEIVLFAMQQIANKLGL